MHENNFFQNLQYIFVLYFNRIFQAKFHLLWMHGHLQMVMDF
jgi:hypothetical protein